MPKVSRRKSCKKSETRDLVTKRCRKKVSRGRKPCKKSQIRDLATKRCRMKKSMKKSKKRSKPRKKSAKKSRRKYKKRTTMGGPYLDISASETDVFMDGMGDEEVITKREEIIVPERPVVNVVKVQADESELMKLAKDSVMKEVSGQFDGPVDKIINFFTLLIAALKDPEKWKDMPDIDTSMLVECFRLSATKAESKNNDMNATGVEMILEGFEKEGARIFKMIKENYFDQYLAKDEVARDRFESLKATLQDDEKRAAAMFNYLMINPPKVRN